MSTTSPLGRVLDPPNDSNPIDPETGQHTDVWTMYHQAVADRLAVLAVSTIGVVDGSDADAGHLGEYMTATASGIGLTSNVAANIVSLDLTAGDWDVSGNVQFSAGSGTHNLFAAGVDVLDTIITANFPAAALVENMNAALKRYNLTATVTVWLVAQASFTGGVTASGTIRARRAR
jgi:hypothetical protein